MCFWTCDLICLCMQSAVYCCCFFSRKHCQSVTACQCLKMEQQKTQFYELLAERVDKCKIGSSKFYITQDCYNKIQKALACKQGEKCTEGAKFKAWAKGNYELRKIGSKEDMVFCKRAGRPLRGC